MGILSRRAKGAKGFTLLEILLVIAIIAILAAIVIIAINPGKQLADSRNAQRRTDVNTILNGIYQYSVDNNGNLPAGVTTTDTTICRSGAADCTGYADLSTLTTSGRYLVSIPFDPSNPTAPSTGYNVVQNANGRVTVSAPSAEQGASITVTR